MKRILLLLSALGCVALIGAYAYAQLFYLPKKTKTIAIQVLKEHGFPTIQYQSVSQTYNRVSLHQVSLDKQSLSTIQEINIKTLPALLLLGRSPLQSITIRNMSLLGAVEGNTPLSFSGINDNKNLIKAIRELPFTDIYIENGVLDILTDNHGGIRLKVNGHIKKSNTISVINAYINSTQKNVSFSAKLTGEINEDTTISLTADAEQLSIKSKELHIKRGTANADFTYMPENGSLNYFAQATISSALWHGFPLRHAQFNLKKEGEIFTVDGKGNTHGNEDIEWRIRSIATPNEVQRDIKIMPPKTSSLTNYIQRNKGTDISPAIPPTLDSFSNPTLSIHHLLNKKDMASSNGVFNIDIDNDRTPIRLSGKFTVDDKKINAVLDPQDAPLMIDNQDKGKYLNASFTYNMDGVLTFRQKDDGTSSLKWAIKPHIKTTRINFGSLFLEKKDRFTLQSKNGSIQNIPFNLPLNAFNKGNLLLSFDPIDTPHIESIKLNIFGGQIRTGTPITQSGEISTQNEFSVSDINLDSLFSKTGFNNVRVAGKLGGIIPVKVDGENTMINGGILQSQEGGVVHIPADLAYKFFPGNTKKTIAIREALKNYHYEYFEIRLDGNITGRTMTTLTARGYNPDMKGEPVIDINMQVETQLSEFFKNIIE